MEDLSTKFVEFATLNSTDVSTSVDNLSSVLNAFGQSSDDAGNLLDALNQVGQATGVSMDTLSQDLRNLQKAVVKAVQGLIIDGNQEYMAISNEVMNLLGENPATELEDIKQEIADL